MTAKPEAQPYLYRDGSVSLQGEVYPPTCQPNGGAVLVVHEADGIGGNVRRHCLMLADLGYFAMAADMHGGGEPLGGEAMQRALKSFREQPDLVRGRVAAGFDALMVASGVDASHSAAIGFCFGGFAALELARAGANVAAVGSFHGLLTTARPAKRGDISARIAVFTGALDPLVPGEDVASFKEEMSAAGVDWQLSVYGKAKHSFTNEDVDRLNDPRMAYDPLAHRLSWNMLTDFLDISLPTTS